MLNSNIAYIANESNIVACSVNSVSGSLSGCNTLSGASLSDSQSINTISNYAYIANTTGTSYVQCSISSADGSFANCIQNTLPASMSGGFAFY